MIYQQSSKKESCAKTSDNLSASKIRLRTWPLPTQPLNYWSHFDRETYINQQMILVPHLHCQDLEPRQSCPNSVLLSKHKIIMYIKFVFTQQVNYPKETFTKRKLRKLQHNPFLSAYRTHVNCHQTISSPLGSLVDSEAHKHHLQIQITLLH